MIAIVDDEDFELVSSQKWYAFRTRDGYWYAKSAITYMHRLILGARPEDKVDHCNNNGLDNRRKNIRLCTTAENNRNRKKVKNCSSPYKGVSWESGREKWNAQIRKGDKRITLGRFVDEIDAAKAYDKAAIELFGEFANINFPG